MLLTAFGIVFVLLILSTIFDLFILYPLLIALFLFGVIAVKRGWKPADVMKMLLKGALKTWPVVQIFTLIGILIGLWFSAGSIAWIVYNGLSLMIPELFILFAFILSVIVSFLLGTSFGTVGTIGVILMIMARTGDIAPAPLVGAIIAGAYVGDRNSPMSSSAHLVATLTKTDIYINIKNMFKTSFIPLLCATLFYLVISLNLPFKPGETEIIGHIPESFNLSLWNMTPVLTLIILVITKINVKTAMIISSLNAFLVSLFFQHMEFVTLLRTMVFGFELNNADPLFDIFRGGGIMMMFNAMLIVLASSAFAGLFEHTDLIVSFERKIEGLTGKTSPFFSAVVTSVITASLGVTQALSIIMSEQLLKKPYEIQNRDKYDLALDIADSAVLLSVAIPWNVAGLIPAKMLGYDARFIPFACFLFFVPGFRLLLDFKRRKAKSNERT
ncbi:MAG TPA: Na+/H+ antiporter NhaC family protein [Thermotogota bacterium]|nr:Na+/H+ antiporter NhaC family protein [Thermotogota bacterium]